jgi:Holliday junction resolvase
VHALLGVARGKSRDTGCQRQLVLRGVQELTNKSKDKGTKAETEVVKLMRECGWLDIERRALQGGLDRGDIAGMKGVIFEVKAEEKPSFGVYQREALIEAMNDGYSIPIVVWKKPHKNVKQWVAMIPMVYLMGEVLDFTDDSQVVRWATLDLIDMLWYLKEMKY